MTNHVMKYKEVSGAQNVNIKRPITSISVFFFFCILKDYDMFIECSVKKILNIFENQNFPQLIFNITLIIADS